MAGLVVPTSRASLGVWGCWVTLSGGMLLALGDAAIWSQQSMNTQAGLQRRSRGCSVVLGCSLMQEGETGQGSCI
jgi:hypothetical protein